MSGGNAFQNQLFNDWESSIIHARRKAGRWEKAEDRSLDCCNMLMEN